MIFFNFSSRVCRIIATAENVNKRLFIFLWLKTCLDDGCSFCIIYLQTIHHRFPVMLSELCRKVGQFKSFRTRWQFPGIWRSRPRIRRAVLSPGTSLIDAKCRVLNLQGITIFSHNLIYQVVQTACRLLSYLWAEHKQMYFFFIRVFNIVLQTWYLFLCYIKACTHVVYISVYALKIK